MNEKLEQIVVKLRKRLTEFRGEQKDNLVSIHIISLEISVGLVELSINTEPARAILPEEERWFKAGFYLDSVLQNSKWSDLADMYYQMIDEVKKRNYFRH